jgi:hypothetical protein
MNISPTVDMGTTVTGTGASGKPKKKKKKEGRDRGGHKVAFHWPRLLRKGSEVLVAVHFHWRTGIIMRSHVIPDTFYSEMATFRSSGLKIQVDGRLCTLFKNRKDWDKFPFLFLFPFIKIWRLNIGGMDICWLLTNIGAHNTETGVDPILIISPFGFINLFL